MELLGKLGIEWPLLLAQAVNFLLLVFILNKFLYKPIIKMLDERKAKAESLQIESSKMEEKRTQFDKWTEDQINEARRKSEMILTEAEKFSGKLKSRKLDDMALERQRTLLEGQKQLNRERITLEREIRESIARESAERMRDFFKQELGQDGMVHKILIDKTISEISDNLKNISTLGKVVQAEVLTASALIKTDKEKIQKALEKKLGHNVKISDAIDPGLIAGIKITLGGYEFDGSLVARLKVGK